MGDFRYQAYGLTIRSSFRIPELGPAPANAEVDLQIEAGPLPTELAGAEVRTNWLDLDRQAAMLKVHEVARYLTTDGNRVVIDVDPLLKREDDELEPDVRLYLLGTVLISAVYQRGWLPFHMSSVDTPVGACAFSGQSGDGKSTIAAWLYRRRGFPLLSDDVSLTRVEGDQVRLFPGPRKLKLWEDTLAAIDFDSCHVRQDMTGHPKYQVYLGDDQPGAVVATLRYLVLLERCEPGQAPELIRLGGSRAFEGVMGSVHRPALAHFYLSQNELMSQVMDVSSRVDVLTFRRPWELSGLDAAMQPVLEFLDEAGAKPRARKAVDSGVGA